MRNINSVQVELKQWLYKNGDQCVWNTGGWIKGAISASNPRGTYSAASGASASVTFNAKNIMYTCNGYANSGSHREGGPSEGYNTLFGRDGISLVATFATVKPLIKNGTKYSKVVVSGANAGLRISFRTGVANSASVNINTATILQSGSANGLTLNMQSGIPYIVMGAIYNTSAYSRINWDPGNVNVNYNCTITEIYLV